MPRRTIPAALERARRPRRPPHPRNPGDVTASLAGSRGGPVARTLTRRQALAGGVLGVAAAAGGAALVQAGVLPGRYRLAQVVGACDVALPPVTVAPGPTRFGAFSSQLRGRTVGYGVAWPPGSAPGARLPVCLLLHAAAGDHRAPFDRLRMHHHLAEAVGARRVAPFALASADGGGSSWRPGGGDDPFGMLLEELLLLLAGLGLRTTADAVGVAGWSMGGGGALRLAAAAPRAAPLPGHRVRSLTGPLLVVPGVTACRGDAHRADGQCTVGAPPPVTPAAAAPPSLGGGAAPGRSSTSASSAPPASARPATR
jgi:hypothetical protein